MNPNLCETCDHKRHPDGGWCYIFQHEPRCICYQHTEAAVLGCVLKPIEERDSVSDMGIPK